MDIAKYKLLFSKIAVKRGIALKVLLFASAFAVNVYAQEMDTAFVPFIVNVDAAVTAQGDYETNTPMSVTANTADTLIILIEKTASITQRSQNALNNAPVIINNNRGNVSLNLSGQIYKNAEISLYSINGRRILHAKADVLQRVKNISRPNLVPGVYLLSVKSANGESFSNRLIHHGGSLNINATFGDINFSTGSPVITANAAASNDWTITVSAEGYGDTSYVFNPVKGMNDAQRIFLRNADGTHFNPNITYGSLTDERDDQIYRTIKIGSQVWMAENLNYTIPGNTYNLSTRCYDNNPDSCAKFGRLYTWPAAMMLPVNCASNECQSQVQPQHQGVCPDGWHIPSSEEWRILLVYVQDEVPYEVPLRAQYRLKAQTGWFTGSSNYLPGTDDYGFSALPGGLFNGSEFGNGGAISGARAIWWSTTEYDRLNARYRFMWNYSNPENWGAYWTRKSNLFSVRCVQDTEEEEDDL